MTTSKDARRVDGARFRLPQLLIERYSENTHELLFIIIDGYVANKKTDVSRSIALANNEETRT